MIAASSLAFPGSKTLALWWSQLALFKPMQLWVGHLFIHRVEALAEMVLPEQADPLHLLLLRAVALDQGQTAPTEAAPSPRAFLERLDRRLHLGPGVIGRLLDDLRGPGLLTSTPIAALTEPGRQAAATGQYPKRSWGRRELVFVERLRADGARLLPPHFLALASCPGQRWQADADAGFELGLLGQALRQPPAWKETFAFPQEIGTIAEPEDDRPDPPHWQRVVLDRPERLLAAVVAGGADQPEKILVFAAVQDGWELRADRPIGTFAWSGRHEFPELAQPANWARAWQEWCQARQLTPAEAQACTLTQSGHQLNIQAPEPLRSRLLTGKNDLLKGEAWLLAGDGYLRLAANLRLQAL